MSKECRIRVSGPLATYVDGFRDDLAAQGYTVQVRDRNLRLLAQVSRWMAGRGLSVDQLTPEGRHAQLNSTQLVAPVFLHDPARIEGLLCCHFIAQLVQALIERQIRAAMAKRGIRQLLVYPEDRGSTAPTAARVLDVFTGLARHHLIDQHGHRVQTFQPELDPLQRQILNLLGVPQTAYLTA